MRDYADKKYTSARANQDGSSGNKQVQGSGWLKLVPSWAWLVFGIFVGYGLANVPFLSSLKKADTGIVKAPNFDEKLAQEIQDLKANNEAINEALKEDLANIKKASLEAGNAAKKAAKQAEITAGQVEKTARQTSEKVEVVEQKIGDVEKLVKGEKGFDNSSSKLEQSTDLDKKNSVKNEDEKSNKNQNTSTKTNVEDVKEPKIDSTKAKNIQKDASLDFDFYELLPQSEIKIEKPKGDTHIKDEENSLIVLQVGSFRKETDAKRHKTNLDKLNLGESKIVKAQMRGEDWFRVYLGPYNSRRKATEMQNRLAQSGFEALQIKLK